MPMGHFFSSGYPYDVKFFLSPKEQPLEGLLSLLINVFIPLLSKHLSRHFYILGKEPSVIFTNINNKWLLSLRSSLEKEKQDVMNAGTKSYTEERCPLQNV